MGGGHRRRLGRCTERGGDRVEVGVELVVDGRTLNVEVASETPANAGLLADLGSFRCPEAW